MRSRHVANTVVVLALSVGAALAGRVIGAGPVLNRRGRSEHSKNEIFSYQVAVAPATLVTVVVIATLRILRAAQGAVDGAGPVTDRTHGVLEPHVEGESPLPVTEGVCVDLCLTRRALEETGLPCRSTLPEPAAVCKGGGH